MEECKCNAEQHVDVEDFKTLISVVAMMAGRVGPEEYHAIMQGLTTLGFKYGLIDESKGGQA